MTVAAVNLLEGFHRHHIIPKHLGGNDSPENLILLHPYDHAIAHFVRWKIYGTHGDAWAFNKLKAWLDSGGLTVRGMKHSEDAKKKIAKASSSRVRKPHTDETKLKISTAKKGKPSNRRAKKLSAETIEKLKQSHIGQKPWNKGLVGAQVPWNKGKSGLQKSGFKGVTGIFKWTEEAKKRHSEKIKSVWAKRKECKS
jgi:hypothetical protein